MVQNNSITWNENYENDGILYFIQRIIELLDYNTIDIFRAPLLNTTRLINEYKRISNENVKQYHLNEVLIVFHKVFLKKIFLEHNSQSTSISTGQGNGVRSWPEQNF